MSVRQTLQLCGYAGRSLGDTVGSVYLTCDYLSQLVGSFGFYLCDRVVLARDSVNAHQTIYPLYTFDSREDSINLAPYQHKGSHNFRIRTPGT